MIYFYSVYETALEKDMFESCRYIRLLPQLSRESSLRCPVFGEHTEDFHDGFTFFVFKYFNKFYDQIQNLP